MVFVDKLRRSTSVAAAALLILASFVPLLVHRSASAYTLLGEREIRLSTSEGGAAGVSYLVNYEVPDTSDIGGIVVAFCAESPIIGDEDCAVPAGFSLDSATVDDAGGDVDLSTFGAVFSNEANGGAAVDNTLTFSAASAVTPAAGNEVEFTIENVTNPTDTNGTFYARIMVYETEAAANGYDLATVNPDQAGGIALSTAELITIEAKVQERITFCVYTSAIDYTDCSTVDANDPVALGDPVTGVLDSNAESISKDAKFNITTNAGAGATIRMAGTTLETGGFSIDAIGDTAVTSDIGNEQFGLCVYTDAGSTDAATLNPIAPYDSGDCSATTAGQGTTNAGSATFAFHTDTGVLYGSPIALKNAGSFSTGILTFIGNISDTTEPGIYTTTLDFIATGRY